MKKIRIFIGSSIEELAQERSELMRFIGGLNNKYIDRGIFIEGYVCEETSSQMQADGTQKQHNDYIEHDADAAIFMFFTKAGQYTLEELELARKTFLAGKRPNVFVFFKAVDSAPAATEEIKACVAKVAEDYGHYFKMFDSADTVKLELLQYLVDALPGSVELKVEDGRVYLSGECVQNIDASNVFAYQNNPDLKRLKEEIARLLTAMTAASAKGDVTKALRLSAQLGETQKTYHELEKSILDMLRSFYEENKKGGKADPRRMEALRLLELGRIEEAKALIPQEELSDRAQSVEARKDLADRRFADEANEIVEDALVRIKALELDIGNRSRFAETEAAYDSVYKTAQLAERYDVIYDYGCFLCKQNNYPKAAKIAEKLRYLFDDPDREASVQDKDRADLLNLLGLIYNGNKDLQKVEAVYRESMTIYRQLAERDKAAYEPNVAVSCNNLAIFFDQNGQPDQAEKLYWEALEIYRRLAKTVSCVAYEPDVAGACNNLANLYYKNGQPEQAEKLYREALEIRRRLVETVSRAAYEPDMAGTCNNLASFYSSNGRPEQAERLYLEALAIYRGLAETVNRAAYEPAVAGICNNLASFYSSNGRPEQAEQLYLEALAIRRRLAETVSRAAYEPDVATTCNSLAAFYGNNGQPKQAEKLYLEALEIYRRLAETVSRAAYEPSVANTCNNLAVFYMDNGQPEQAEKLYREALEIRRRLAETVNRADYEPDVAMTCYNLAIFYEDSGKQDEADRLFEEALTIAKRHSNNYCCAQIIKALS